MAIQLALMTRAAVMEFSDYERDKLVDRIMKLFLYGAAENRKHLHR